MKIFTAPEINSEDSSEEINVFLAGTITGTGDWQSYVLSELKKYPGMNNINVFNPRRPNFDVSDPTASEKQIEWEADALIDADIYSFWFAKETVAPITLFELGKYVASSEQTEMWTPAIVGVDPEYPRRKDVEVQLRIARPDIKIVYSLDDLVSSLIAEMQDYWDTDDDDEDYWDDEEDEELIDDDDFESESDDFTQF